MQELQDLKQEKQRLQQRCEQQEQALQEMGLHLSQSVFPAVFFFSVHLVMQRDFFFSHHLHLCQRSKLKMEDFKEVNKALKVTCMGVMN